MRHQAAYGRNASFWEDLGIGVAVFSATAVVIFDAVAVAAVFNEKPLMLDPARVHRRAALGARAAQAVPHSGAVALPHSGRCDATGPTAVA